jgi:hypothetical protein
VRLELAVSSTQACVAMGFTGQPGLAIRIKHGTAYASAFNCPVSATSWLLQAGLRFSPGIATSAVGDSIPAHARRFGSKAARPASGGREYAPEGRPELVHDGRIASGRFAALARRKSRESIARRQVCVPHASVSGPKVPCAVAVGRTTSFSGWLRHGMRSPVLSRVHP